MRVGDAPARPVVADPQRRLPRLDADGKRDQRRALGVAQRVVDRALDDLTQPFEIARHDDVGLIAARRRFEPDGDVPTLGRALEGVDRAGAYGTKPDALELQLDRSAFRAGNPQHVLDATLQALGPAADHPEGGEIALDRLRCVGRIGGEGCGGNKGQGGGIGGMVRRLRDRSARQARLERCRLERSHGDLAFAEDHRQRRAQLVGNVGEEAAAAAVDLRQLVVGGAQIGGAIGHRGFQRRPVGRDALLAAPQPRRHPVEHNGEQAEFVSVAHGQAQVALALADRHRRLADLGDRRQDRPGDEPVHDERDHQRHSGGDERRAGQGRGHFALLVAPGLDAAPVGLHQEEQVGAGQGGEAVEGTADEVAAALAIGLGEGIVDLANKDVEAGAHLFEGAGAGGGGIDAHRQVGRPDRLGDLRLEGGDGRVDRRFRVLQPGVARSLVVDRGDRDQPVLLNAAGHFGEDVEAALRIKRPVDRAVGDAHAVDHAGAGEKGDEQASEHQDAEPEGDGAQAGPASAPTGAPGRPQSAVSSRLRGTHFHFSTCQAGCCCPQTATVFCPSTMHDTGGRSSTDCCTRSVLQVVGEDSRQTDRITNMQQLLVAGAAGRISTASGEAKQVRVGRPTLHPLSSSTGRRF